VTASLATLFGNFGQDWVSELSTIHYTPRLVLLNYPLAFAVKFSSEFNIQ
jgi:hypothetical protein